MVGRSFGSFTVDVTISALLGTPDRAINYKVGAEGHTLFVLADSGLLSANDEQSTAADE